MNDRYIEAADLIKSWPLINALDQVDAPVEFEQTFNAEFWNILAGLKPPRASDGYGDGSTPARLTHSYLCNTGNPVQFTLGVT